jgi:hypothetical protein
MDDVCGAVGGMLSRDTLFATNPTSPEPAQNLDRRVRNPETTRLNYPMAGD